MNAPVDRRDFLIGAAGGLTLPVRLWTGGQQVVEPGLYAGVPMAVYHGQPCAGPSVSSSGLRKLFSKSPAHFFCTSSLNPARLEQKDSAAFAFGRAAHHLHLGEASFGALFALKPEELAGKPWHGNRTECRAWLADQALAGKTVLSGEDVEALRGMAAVLAQEPLVQAGILGGLIEHSMFFQDGATGIWIKVRPDAIPTDALDFTDYKTTTSAELEAVDRAIGDFDYHMQGAMVGMACRAVLGREMSSFTFVFQEKTAPFCVTVKTLTPEDLALGESQVRVALDVMARCLERDRWPGPAGEQTDAAFARLPPWVRDRAERRMASYAQEYAL